MEIWERTGIFGLGQRTCRYLCDRCSKDVTNEKRFSNPTPPTSHCFCRDCAMALKVDLNPHDWPSDEALFDAPESWSWHWMKDTSDGKEKFIKHCNRCASLMVGLKIGKKLDRLFYYVGSNSPKTKEPKCHENKSELERGHPKDRWNCKHTFVEVATSRVSDSEGKKLLNELRQSAAHQILGAIDHESVAYGRRYIWCSKCGLFYDLPKYRDNELKKIGINTEWYL
jgi:hypothetical protein